MTAAGLRAVHFACAQYLVSEFQGQRYDVQQTTKAKLQVGMVMKFHRVAHGTLLSSGTALQLMGVQPRMPVPAAQLLVCQRPVVGGYSGPCMMLNLAPMQTLVEDLLHADITDVQLKNVDPPEDVCPTAHRPLLLTPSRSMLNALSCLRCYCLDRKLQVCCCGCPAPSASGRVVMYVCERSGRTR